MKKSTLILMTLAALFAFAGCSESNDPTAVISTAAADAPTTDGSAIEKIMQINIDTGEFTTLVAALKSQGLIRPLIQYKRATVFAPTDAAFAELGLDASNVADLEGLGDILTYHVVPEILYAADVLAVEMITMANGLDTMVSLREDGAYINDSRIDETDVRAPSGVVHVINAVLLP